MLRTPWQPALRDALVIVNPGACNPSGVALSIAAAVCRRPDPELSPDRGDRKLIIRSSVRYAETAVISATRCE
jgi:hypothetical protein